MYQYWGLGASPIYQYEVFKRLYWLKASDFIGDQVCVEPVNCRNYYWRWGKNQWGNWRRRAGYQCLAWDSCQELAVLRQLRLWRGDVRGRRGTGICVRVFCSPCSTVIICYDYLIIWVALPESFRTSIRGFSESNHEDIFWNFPNWSTSNLRNWVSIYRQLQADCLYHVNCLYNFPAYSWRQKRNAFPGLCSGSIFMI